MILGNSYTMGDVSNRVNKIFETMDADGNGELSRAEFLEGAKMDKTIVEAFSVQAVE